MGKADELLRRVGSNMAESLGMKRTDKPTGTPVTGPAEAAKYEGRTRSRNAGEMEIDRIIPDPKQPRQQFDQESLEHLAVSIKEKGLLAPIRVRWDAGLAKWVILCGERRYRAAKIAGLTSLSCSFVEGELTETERLEEQIIENVHREDLTPIEQAKAYRAMMEHNSWTGKQLAERLHLNPSAVTRVVALLELPADVQEKVTAGEISPRTAYEISKLPDEASQRAMAEQVLAAGLTTEATAEVVRAKASPGKSRKRRRRATERGTSPAAVEEIPSLPTTLAYEVRGGKVWVTLRKPLASTEEVLTALEEAVGHVRAQLGMHQAKAA